MLSICVCVVAAAGPGLLQYPGSIGEPIHFPFIAEEIAGPAYCDTNAPSGNRPAAVLMEYPVARLLRVFTTHATPIVLAYVVVLQVACLSIPVVLPARVGRWRAVVPAIAVRLPPVVAAVVARQSPPKYFATSPARTIIMAAVILLAFLALRCGRGLS